MIRTAWIYFYAGLLVVGTIFKLNQIKRIIRRNPEKVTEEDIFMTPKSVSRKVIKKTGSTVIVKGKENLPKVFRQVRGSRGSAGRKEFLLSVYNP